MLTCTECQLPIEPATSAKWWRMAAKTTTFGPKTETIYSNPEPRHAECRPAGPGWQQTKAPASGWSAALRPYHLAFFGASGMTRVGQPQIRQFRRPTPSTHGHQWRSHTRIFLIRFTRDSQAR